MQKIYVHVNAYLSHCRYEKNLSPKTIKAYLTDLKQFIEFLSTQQHIRQINDIDKKVIRAYIKSITGYEPKTIKRKIASTKALFNFLEYEDEILFTKNLPGDGFNKYTSIVYCVNWGRKN
jgi:integrase/recombinase XerD